MSKLAKGRLCVVHNNIAEASVRLDVVEQRIIAYLVSFICPNDKDFERYVMPVKDLSERIGIQRKDFYRQVKETTKVLIKKVMTLKPLDGKPGEIQVSWLSSARYYDGIGVVELCFDPNLKPYLLQLKEHFTKFPLEDVIRFKSQYSMPIYLMLKQYLTIGSRQLSVNVLRQKLDLKEQYLQYGHFKARVISTAVKEINERTTISVEFEEVRLGRKVEAIRFTMKAKSQKPNEINMSELPNFSTEQQTAAAEIKQAKETASAGNEKSIIKKYNCPTCGQGYLKRRINGQTQQPFWGCSCYPSCKYNQDIDPAVEEAEKKRKSDEITARVLRELEEKSRAEVSSDIKDPDFKRHMARKSIRELHQNKSHG